jgi:predicted ATPase/DNA-binding SARP family transcriptional activator/Tfp pilus assembly protein PilF
MILHNPSAFAITLFGPLQVRVNGLPLPALRSRKPLWLLALLTLRPNRPIEREWLAGTLWPDLDQSRAFANLRSVLSELRKALATQGNRLQSPDRTTLMLDLAEADVDVLRFDAAIKSGQLADLEQAMALYSGPLLEGCTEEWVFQERNAREHHCLQALQKLGDAALAAGDYPSAVRYYKRAAGMDPWWETAQRGWMEALAKSGDTNAALQVYRKFVEVLRNDPTAVPDEQTRALYQRLRSQAHQRTGSPKAVTVAAAPAPSVKGYLPHALTDLVGREDERLEVRSCLRHSRLVTLTGVGGIGKTRLASEVAGEVVGEYADGVWLVALDALVEGRLVVRQIASVLGLKEAPGRLLLESVTEYLRLKRVLLVLDNCEHLLEASAQVVAHLLGECSELRILATSREALGIAGETVWRVPALAVPVMEHLPPGPSTLVRVLMGYESVQLFVERAQAVRQSFALSGSNARAVAQACQQLEGIPLAIELAAARVRAMDVGQIASRLNDYLGLLSTGSRTAQSRQQTLRATLDWSYALLSEAERSLLRRLSVFAGGWTLEAAEQVCGDFGLPILDFGLKVDLSDASSSGQEPAAIQHPPEFDAIQNPKSKIQNQEVLDLLTSLVDKSLIVFEERGPGEGRYRLLEMVRQYAAESLQASGEVEPVKSKHRDWFVAVAQEEEPRLRSAEQEMSLRRLETEYENLRAALAWCRGEASGALAGLRLAGVLGRFWEVRGYLTEGRRYFEEALGQEGAAGRTPERARALNWAAGLAWLQGDYASARVLFGESLGIRRELGDQEGVAASLNGLGVVAKEQGDYASARVLFEESLGIRRKLGDQKGISGSLNNLGNMALDQGDYASARALLEESLGIRRELGDRQGISGSLNNLGNMALEQGDYASARALFEEALTLNREFGNRVWEAINLDNLGILAHHQGDHASARILNEESLGIKRELGDQKGIAQSQSSLGIIAIAQGDYASARSLHEASLGIRQELGDQKGIAQSLEMFATLALKAESGERAARLWGAASALRESIGARQFSEQQEDQERHMATAREEMGEAAFAAAWEIGRALTWEQAVAYALKNAH